jgi:hypothetical protein
MRGWDDAQIELWNDSPQLTSAEGWDSASTNQLGHFMLFLELLVSGYKFSQKIADFGGAV